LRRYCDYVELQITLRVRRLPLTKILLQFVTVRHDVELSQSHGRRAFSVPGARVWNDLPADVTSVLSLFTFRKRLKLHLFPLSYLGLVL